MCWSIVLLHAYMMLRNHTRQYLPIEASSNVIKTYNMLEAFSNVIKTFIDIAEASSHVFKLF